MKVPAEASPPFTVVAVMVTTVPIGHFLLDSRKAMGKGPEPYRYVEEKGARGRTYWPV